MPPLPLAAMLLPSLPWLSPRGRAVLNFLVCNNGRVPSAERLAARLGLRTRYQLARLLRREGLPPYEALTSWMSLLFWRVEADRTHQTLRALAGRSAIDPATSYRLVRRLSGTRWTQLAKLSTTEILQRFVALCGQPRTHATKAVTSPRPGRDAAPAERFAGAAPLALPTRIAMEGAPCAVARHGASEIYVALGHAAAVKRLEADTGRRGGPIAVGCVPSCIAIDPGRARAYVSVQFEGAIAVVDLVTQTVMGRIPFDGNPFPLQLSRDGNVLYTATNEDRLHALWLPTGRISATLALPGPAHFLALHPAGHRLYVAAREAGTVLEVDTARFQVVRTFVLQGICQEMAVTADGRFLYVANERHGLDGVRLLDGRIARVAQVTGRAVHLTLTEDERTIFLALYEGGAVAAVDRQSGTVRMIQTGGRPRSMAPVLGGRTLVVSNEAGWVDLLPTSYPYVTRGLVEQNETP